MSHHGRARTRRMTGRDPHEPTRAATPLELLFDLAFVVAFGVASEQAAHAVVADHVGVGLLGFGFSMFAVLWAWINFSWFASAFDTDDWFYRVTTMVQMIGVVVLALGLPDMFHSLEGGDHVDNDVMVAGYVVMRLAMVVQWLRAARQAPEFRATAHLYVWILVVTQAGWVVLAVVPVGIAAFFVVGTLLGAVEMAGPWVAERLPGGAGDLRGTPWHAHHIVERYGLLAIITLGEGVIGTVASLNVVVGEDGWSVDAVLVVVAGIGLTFGLWWTYYITPAAVMLHRHRERSFVWGYGQMVALAALAAVGAGLHVAAYYLDGESHLGALATVVAVAVPVLAFVVIDYLLYGVVVRTFDPFHVWLVLGAVALLAGAVAAAALGAHMAWALLLVMLAPAVTVVGYETVGHRHVAQVLAADAR